MLFFNGITRIYCVEQMLMQIPSGNLPLPLVKPCWFHKEVTKTAIHRLAARGWLQKGVNPIDSPCKMPNFIAEKKYFDSLVQKMVLVYIAKFALHCNCERGEFFHQLHPHPAFLPIFNFPGEMRCEDGDSRLRPL